jgi:hypothetical protein
MNDYKGTINLSHQAGDCYEVTGVLVNGRWFKVIKTTNPMHALGINLWHGSVWHVRDGKRYLVKRVVN